MGWAIKKLADVCNLQNGFAFKSKDYVESSNTLNIRMSNIRPDGSFNPDHNIRFLPDDYVDQYSSFLLNDGDLVIAMTDMAGDPKILGLPTLVNSLNGRQFLLNQRVGKLYDFSDDIYVPYLRYYLSSPIVKEYYKAKGAGGLQINISKKDVLSADIPLPPIPEQKRIVAILDQAFADIEQARAKTEQNLKNARELFESYLQQVFSQHGEGWVEKGLKDISLEFGRGKSKHRPRNDESLYGGDYPFIQTGDVRNCEHLITNYSKTYNDKGLAQSKLWPKGTICITIAANIAETGILDFEGCFPDSVIGVVVNPAVTTIRYVEYLLQSFKTILKAKGQGSAQDNINMGTFEKMVFPFPTSIEVQNNIVNSLDGIMNSVQQLERIYSDKLKSIDELKKSILQKAFSGELTKEKEGAVA